MKRVKIRILGETLIKAWHIKTKTNDKNFRRRRINKNLAYNK